MGFDQEISEYSSCTREGFINVSTFLSCFFVVLTSVSILISMSNLDMMKNHLNIIKGEFLLVYNPFFVNIGNFVKTLESPLGDKVTMNVIWVYNIYKSTSLSS